MIIQDFLRLVVVFSATVIEAYQSCEDWLKKQLCECRLVHKLCFVFLRILMPFYDSDTGMVFIVGKVSIET